MPVVFDLDKVLISDLITQNDTHKANPRPSAREGLQRLREKKFKIGICSAAPQVWVDQVGAPPPTPLFRN